MAIKLTPRMIAIAVSAAGALGACGGSGDGTSGGAIQCGDAGCIPDGGTGAAGAPGAPVCGNLVVEAGEDCDGMVPAGSTCASATMNSRPVGTVSCAACKISIVNCTTASTGAGGGLGTGGGTGTGGGVGTGGGP